MFSSLLIICYGIKFTNITTGPYIISTSSHVVFEDCYFHKISTGDYASCIIINHIACVAEIMRCGFVQCSSRRGVPSAGSIICFKSKGLNIIMSCFEMCHSPHGQSYGIIGDNDGSCDIVEMNFTYESKIGHWKSCNHPSYVGGYLSMHFCYNNNSFSIVANSFSCGFYFNYPKETSHISMNQVAHGKGVSTIFFYTSFICPSISLFNIINNTVSSSQIDVNMKSSGLTIDGFIFSRFSDVNLVVSTQISSPITVFQNCIFDVSQISLKSNNCLMSSGNQYETTNQLHYISMFNVDICIMKGEYHESHSRKKFGASHLLNLWIIML